jgi:hypothetical protein
VIYDMKSHVYRLKKSMYGLKQTPRAWCKKMDGFLMSLGFSKSVANPNLYYYIVGDESLILVTCSGSLVLGYKQALTSDFEMKDMGMMHYFLGQEVCKRTDEIFLSQGKYTVGILNKFSMKECKSMPTTMMMYLKKMNDDDLDEIDPQLIGSLMYLVNTRPDICYAMNVLSQFMSQPRQTHWIAVKHVLRYIRGTVGYVPRYASSVNLSLQGYADTNWAESTVDRKSTSDCCFTLGFSMVS